MAAFSLEIAQGTVGRLPEPEAISAIPSLYAWVNP